MAGVNIEIPFGGKKHQRILEALIQRKRYSQQKFSEKFQRMTTDEEQYKAYIPETDNDALRRQAREEDGEPQYTTLKIPYSYALLLASHTYQTNVFLSRDPVLQYLPTHGDTPSGSAMDSIMAYQTLNGEHLPAYYIWLMDIRKYGFGVLGHYWEEEIVPVSQIKEVEEMVGEVVGTGRMRKEKITARIPGYVGTKLHNVRPQDTLPDPRVTLGNFQKGEYFGWYTEMPWWMVQERARKSIYIKENVEALKKMSATNEDLGDRDLGSGTHKLPEAHDAFSELSTGIPDHGYVQGFELYVRLIPKDWELGRSEDPEIWVFTVARDRFILAARPLGELHGKFPVVLSEYEIDGHQLWKRSMPELLQPLGEALDWLVNTHFYNVRKTLNNQFVADPSRINVGDIRNSEDGMVIRLRPHAYGTPIDQIIKQLPVQDVTRQHIGDTQILTDLIQRVAGVNDQIMGMLAPGGRKTATEIRGSTNFAMSRMKTEADYTSAAAFSVNAKMLLQTTQQHLDIERKYRLAGDLEPGADAVRTLMVSPMDIAGFFDFVPVDGSMPVDKFAMANLWKELLMGMQRMPQLAQEYPPGRIFEYIAQLSGAKNVKKFKAQVVPDGQIAQEAGRGNIVPIPGGNVGVGVEESIGRVNEPSQVPGVGPVS